MTKNKSTKRALLMSALSLLLCVSMLIGSTYAWFTDSVTSAGNIIKSGTLDVDLVDAGGNSMAGEVIEFVAADGRAQNEILWEPGCTYKTEPVYVVNKGNLALKYQIVINGIEGDAKLLEAIEWTVTVGTATTALADLKGELLAGATTEAIVLSGHMKEEAGNEYQDLTVDGISIAVYATQQTYEKDSFDELYDKDATYPAITVDVKTAADFRKAKAGGIINLCADVTLTEAVTLPADAVLCGNGYQINGTVNAGGDLTVSGHVKVTAFSATYYGRTITIGEDSCLEVTGTGRVTLGYDNTFNVTGTLVDAKSADKTTIQPSLIVPGGISITGGNDAVINVENAYVKIGSTTSKNSAADGSFTLNFTNTIAEFTSQLTLAEPTSGKSPTFNINVKDSVLTTATKFIVAAPNSNVVIDNSKVTINTYFRNSGNMTLKNGSVLTGATIQFGENGGNNGTTTVDNSSFTIAASSSGHALDGKGTGKLVLQNGATANVDYYKAMVVEKDATSSFIGTEVI